MLPDAGVRGVTMTHLICRSSCFVPKTGEYEDDVLVFETADDYPHVSEADEGTPFHVFRVAEQRELAIILLIHTVKQYHKSYTTESPDIVDLPYDVVIDEGTNISVFVLGASWVAATIVHIKL